MSKGSKPDEESALSLAYRGLTELPRESIPKLAKVRHLDLSNNNFSYPLNHGTHLAYTRVILGIKEVHGGSLY